MMLILIKVGTLKYMIIIGSNMQLATFLKEILSHCKISDEHYGNRHKITLYVDNQEDHVVIERVEVDDKLYEGK